MFCAPIFSPSRGISVRGKKTFHIRIVEVEGGETPQHTVTVSYAVCWVIKKESDFDVLLPVHLSILLVIDQLNAQILIL